MNRKGFFAILALTGLTMVFIFFGMLNAWQYAPMQTGQRVQVPVDRPPDAGPGLGATPLAPSDRGEEEKRTFNILIVGDSIARGRGDQAGEGLAKVFPNEIDQREVRIVNGGIDGLVSAELHEVLGNPALAEALPDLDLVIVSIGGNDLRRLAASAFRGELVEAGSPEYQITLEAYLENLKKAIAALRAENSAARIIVLGLFNPFEAQELRGFIPRDIQLEILFDWNFRTQQLVEQEEQTVMVPLYDLFKWNTGSFLSFDFIHPNDLGYQKISERIAALLPAK